LLTNEWRQSHLHYIHMFWKLNEYKHKLTFLKILFISLSFEESFKQSK